MFGRTSRKWSISSKWLIIIPWIFSYVPWNEIHPEKIEKLPVRWNF
jgi:hypothetical protein